MTTQVPETTEDGTESISISIRPSLLRRIDDTARVRGWNRSLLMREAVQLWFRLNTESDADRRAS